ncbi:MAG: FIST N-terminal domain-containing protein [Cyanobacteriota bacterium]|nr:FIST N-terminal domain-containing protein [Cyanobacteriota bacterium]
MGSSDLEQTQPALEQALSALQLEQTPRLLVVLAAPRHDLGLLGEQLHRRLGTCPVIGCSTSGEIATCGALSQGLVLWALGGTGVGVSTGWGEGGEQGLRAAAFQAAECLNSLERRRHTVMVLLSDGLGGDQMDVVRGAYDIANIDVPLVGGCAGDYLAMRQTRQLHGQRAMSGAVVAAAITSDRPLGVGVSHGWTPVSEPMLVTQSRGTLLSSLDDRPALDVYLEFFQPPVETRNDPAAFADFAATHPIGIRRRDRIEMRHITGFDLDSRSLVMVAEVPQGALACLTEGNFESVLGAAAESTQAALTALGDTRPVGLLLFDCVSRRSVFGEERIQEETDLIASCSGRIPMAGFYTYGEIARTKGSGGFHNQTLVTLAIG